MLIWLICVHGGPSIPSAITGSVIISCVIGQMKSTGSSFWADAKLNSTERTPVKCVSMLSELVKSQMRMVRSLEPDTNTVESLFTAKQLTYLVCSVNVLMFLPCKSHTLIVLSMLQDSSSVPDILNLGKCCEMKNNATALNLAWNGCDFCVIRMNSYLTQVMELPCAWIAITHSVFIV